MYHILVALPIHALPIHTDLTNRSRALRGSLKLVVDAAQAYGAAVVVAGRAHAAPHARVLAGRLEGGARQAHELGGGEDVPRRARHAGSFGPVRLLGAAALDTLHALRRHGVRLASEAHDPLPIRRLARLGSKQRFEPELHCIRCRNTSFPPEARTVVSKREGGGRKVVPVCECDAVLLVCGGAGDAGRERRVRRGTRRAAFLGTGHRRGEAKLNAGASTAGVGTISTHAI